MSDYINCFILRYLQVNKLEEFMIIKNYSIGYNILNFLYRRLVIKKCNHLNDLKKMNPHLFDETININHLGVDAIKFLNRLCQLDKENVKIINFVPNKDDVNLLSFFQFKNLQQLSFCGDKISDDAIKYLIKCDFKQLVKLFFYQTQITDISIEYLTRCSFKNLKLLYLNKTSITDKAIEFLTKCKFEDLQMLYLSYTKITDKAIENLIKCNFKKLELLDLQNTMVTRNAIEILINSEFRPRKLFWKDSS